MRRLTGLSHVVLVTWSLLVLAPVAWAVLASFKTTGEIFADAWAPPATPRLDTWARAFGAAHIGQYFLNSVIVVGAGTAGTMVLGSMAAYVFARYPFPGSRVLYLAFVAGMAFPVFLALTPLFFVVRDLGTLPVLGPFIGPDTRGGLILVYIAYSLPFAVFFLTAFFRTLPAAVAEAAVIDGCSHTRLFFRIMLPMARPGLVSVTVFNVVGQWNQYLLPLVLLSGSARDKWVLTQGIADLATEANYTADWPALFAALSMSILPVIAVYAVFQRQIHTGLTAGVAK
ncbi:carbohydrate ABC transporter permease [Amycolatopsis sp. NPDC004169]|uniref:carbohydrate ABC transporter permease n=1 Tax=Amycolatopsis sp. NPDC004169 TaxID=3154453 RepID=UPI0033B5C57C